MGLTLFPPQTGRGVLAANPFATWPNSVRWPVRSTDPNSAVSQNDQVEAAMEQQTRNLRELVFYLISSYARYGAFSNNQWNRGNPGTYGSVEGVHDTVHGVTGGGGHMSIVAYSAFDPLFWLHHWCVSSLFFFESYAGQGRKADTYQQRGPPLCTLAGFAPG